MILSGKHANTPDVITMLMGYQNSCQIFDTFACPLQAGLKLGKGKPAIDQQAGTMFFYEGTIALTAAS